MTVFLLTVHFKNPGFNTITSISKVLRGDNSEINHLKDYSVNKISNFKYAPITSCDVEKSFSMFKPLLADNRMSFTLENLKMTFITHCNSSLLN